MAEKQAAAPGATDRWKKLLFVLHETRRSIGYLANLAQNGKDESRMYDADWKYTSEKLAELLDEAGDEASAAAERALGEGS